MVDLVGFYVYVSNNDDEILTLITSSGLVLGPTKSSPASNLPMNMLYKNITNSAGGADTLRNKVLSKILNQVLEINFIVEGVRFVR